MKSCESCSNWIKDPVPFKDIYFGKCTIDNQIKYEFQECDINITMPRVEVVRH